jgi:hypothetical protein
LVSALEKETVMTRRTLAFAILTAMLLVVPVDIRAQTGSVIYACVNNSSGTIIAPTAACNANEIKLQWNTAGPQGPKGDSGPQGAPGPTNLFGLTVTVAGLVVAQPSAAMTGSTAGPTVRKYIPPEHQ